MCIKKGEMLRHQVKTLDKIGYIKSKDRDAKIQQDMLFVSVPLCWTAQQQQVNENTLIEVGKGVERWGKVKDMSLWL